MVQSWKGMDQYLWVIFFSYVFMKVELKCESRNGHYTTVPSWTLIIENKNFKKKRKKRSQKRLKEGVVICQCEKEWGQESLAATIMGVVLVVGTQWVRGPAPGTSSPLFYYLLSYHSFVPFIFFQRCCCPFNFQFSVSGAWVSLLSCFILKRWMNIYTISLLHESQKIDFGGS